MSQTIVLKRSATAGKVPTTSQLELGELSTNTADGKWHFKRGDDTVQGIVTTNSLTTGSINISGSLTISGSQYISDGSLDVGGTATFDTYVGQSSIIALGTITSGNVDAILPSGTTSGSAQIDHDLTTNYVAGEHYIQSAIVEVGTVNTGSITSGFGSIDIGSSALSAGTGSFGQIGVTDTVTIGGATEITGSFGVNGNSALNGNVTLTGDSPILHIDAAVHATIKLDRGASSRAGMIQFATAGTAVHKLGYVANSTALKITNVGETANWFVMDTSGNVDLSQNLVVTGSIESTGTGTFGSTTVNGSLFVRNRGKAYFYADDDASFAYIWNDTGASSQLDFFTDTTLRYQIGGAGEHDFQSGTVTIGGATTITTASGTGLQLVGTGTSDARISFDVGLATDWFIGADYSDSGKFKFGVNGFATSVLDIDTTGVEVIGTLSSTGVATFGGSIQATTSTANHSLRESRTLLWTNDGTVTGTFRGGVWGTSAGGVKIGTGASVTEAVHFDSSQNTTFAGTVTTQAQVISGSLTISGSLVVLGETIEAQITELYIEDKLITVASGSVNGSASDGAGIEIDRGSDSTVALTWDNPEDRFNLNKGLTISGSTFISGALNVTQTITAKGMSTNGSSQSGLYSIALRRSSTGTTNPDIYGDTGDEGVLIGYNTSGTELYVNNGKVTLEADLEFGSAKDILMIDNSGAALEIKEGANPYMRFVTTNGSEGVDVYKHMSSQGFTSSNGITVSSGPTTLLVTSITGATDITGDVQITGSLDVTGDSTIGDGLAIRGAFTPANGQGLEFQGGANNYITAYSRDTSAYKPLFLRGETLTIGTDDTGTALSFIANGEATFSQNLTVSGITSLDAGVLVTESAVSRGAQIIVTSTATDATLKDTRIAAQHYTNAEQPVGLIAGRIDAGSNRILIGGGRAEVNTATALEFYTAVTTTTTTGTLALTIDSSQLATFTAGVAIGGATTISSDLTVTSGDIKLDNARQLHWVSGTEGIKGNQATGIMELDASTTINLNQNTIVSGSGYFRTGDAGATTANTGADDLVIEHSSSGGITILTPDSNASSIAFGSPTDNTGAQLRWVYNNSVFEVGSNKVGAVTALKGDNDITNLTLSGASGAEHAIFAGSTALTGPVTASADITIDNGSGFRVGGASDTYIGEITNVAGKLTIQSDGNIDITIGDTASDIIVIDTSATHVQITGSLTTTNTATFDGNINSNSLIRAFSDGSGYAIQILENAGGGGEYWQMGVDSFGNFDLYNETTSILNIDDSTNLATFTAGITADSASFGTSTSEAGYTVNVDGGLYVSSSVGGASVFKVEGTSGSLFEVVDTFEGTLMSVNDSSGVPIFNVSSSGDIGINKPNAQYELDVNGTGSFTGDLYVSGNLSVIGDINLDDITSDTGSFGAVHTTGNVGIGTSAPEGRLNIDAGKLQFTNVGSDDDVVLIGFAEGVNFDEFELRGDFAGAGGENKLKFTTDLGGGDILTMKGDGKVGIGTSSPTDLMHVSGSGDTAISIQSADQKQWRMLTDTTGVFKLRNQSDSLNIITVAAEAEANSLYISASGNIGIGTTSPAFTLDIVGTGATHRLRLQETTDNTVNTFLEAENSDGSGAVFGIGGSGSANILENRAFLDAQSGTNGIAIGNEVANPIIFYNAGIATSDEVARFDSSGNFLIGTTSATSHADEVLRVNADTARIVNIHRSSTSGGRIQFTNTTTGTTATDGVLFGMNDDEAGQIWNSEASYINFATSDTERMRIASDSYAIGIGTTDIENWSTSFGAIEFFESAIMAGTANDSIYILSNAYYDGAWKHKGTGPSFSTYINADSEGMVWSSATSEVADANAVWVELMRLTPDGLLSGSSSSTASFGTFVGDGSGLTNVTASVGVAAGAGSNTQMQYNNAGTTDGATNLIYDNSSDFVGIRTSTPTAELTVSGSTDLSGSLSVTTTGTFGGDVTIESTKLRINDSSGIGGGNNPQVQFSDNSYNWYLEMESNDFYLREGTTDIMHVARDTNIIAFKDDVQVSGSLSVSKDGGSANESMRIRGYNSADTDITASVNASSDFGSIIEGGNNGSIVVGIRDNDSSDSFSVISGNGSYMSSELYDTLVFKVKGNGDVFIPNGNVQVTGSLKATGEIGLDNAQVLQWKDVGGTNRTTMFVSSSNDVVYKANNGEDHIFQASNAQEFFRIQDNGTSGIITATGTLVATRDSTDISTMRVGQTGTGDAALLVDGSNGDGVGSDYFSIRQNYTDLTVDSFTAANAGNVYMWAGSSTRVEQLVLNTDGTINIGGDTTVTGSLITRVTGITADTTGSIATFRGDSATPTTHTKLVVSAGVSNNTTGSRFISMNVDDHNPVARNLKIQTNGGTTEFGGNVGIGTSLPTASLQIEGATVAGGENYIHMRKTDQGAGQGIFIGQTVVNNNLRIMQHANNSITFHTTISDTQRMEINSSGVNVTGSVDINSSAGSALSVSGVDNQHDMFVVKQGSNEYIAVHTTNSSEQVVLGNTTTNPTIQILDDTQITGSLTVSGSGTSAAPTIAFGDGDTGFYESADDVLEVSIGGNARWEFGTSLFGRNDAGYPLMLNEVASSTNPVFVVAGDADTGIGHSGANELSLIAGGTQIVNVNTSGAQVTGSLDVSGSLTVEQPSGIQASVTVQAGTTNGVVTAFQNVGSGRGAISSTNASGTTDNIMAFGFGAVTAGVPSQTTFYYDQSDQAYFNGGVKSYGSQFSLQSSGSQTNHIATANSIGLTVRNMTSTAGVFSKFDGTNSSGGTSARIAIVHDDSATNEGSIEFMTRPASGALTLALTLDSSQNATFANDLTATGQVNLATDVRIEEFLYHTSDTDTNVRFRTNQMTLSAGGEVVDITNGAVGVTGSLDVTGAISGLTKSFKIKDPVKGGSLVYGSVEAGEHSVSYRGKATTDIIELPEEWAWLTHEDSITVQLTSANGPVLHWFVKVKNNKVYIDSETGIINCFYLIHAERKDVPKLEVNQ